MTNASIMFTAFLVSTVSVVIVFVAGATSGVVRMSTLITRAVFAFFMTGAASYLVLMIFDWYYERQHKKFSSESSGGENEPPKEVNVNNAAKNGKTQATQPEQPTFQPMNFGAKN